MKKITCLAAFVFITTGSTSCVADALRLGGTGAGLQLLQRLGDAYVATAPGVSVEIVPSLGTSGGIAALADRAIDLAVASRPLNTDEAAKGLRSVATARTPFVLVTSGLAPDPIRSGDVAALFGNDQASWADGTLVRLVLRPEAESDTHLLETYFSGMPKALARARGRPEVPVAATDQDNAAAAESTVGSLTAATLVQILSEERDLRVLRIDGVDPTLANLVSGSYPYEKTLHFLIANEARPTVDGFASFLQSPEAAGIMTDVGILPVGDSNP